MAKKPAKPPKKAKANALALGKFGKKSPSRK